MKRIRPHARYLDMRCSRRLTFAVVFYPESSTRHDELIVFVGYKIFRRVPLNPSTTKEQA